MAFSFTHISVALAGLAVAAYFIMKVIQLFKEMHKTKPTHRRVQRGTRGKGRRILYPVAYSNLHILAERLVEKVADGRDKAEMERRLLTELEISGLELYDIADGEVLSPIKADSIALWQDPPLVWKRGAKELSALEKQHYVSSAMDHVLSEEYVSHMNQERRENWLVTNNLHVMNGLHRTPGERTRWGARFQLAWNNTFELDLVEPRL